MNLNGSGDTFSLRIQNWSFSRTNSYFLSNIQDNNFKTKIELFRITVEFWRRNENLIDHFCEKMEFNVTRTFKENPEILVNLF